MKSNGQDPSGNFLIALARDELTLIANALNEVTLELDPAEFSTRTGATAEEASALHSQLSELLEDGLAEHRPE
jgi:hypothetical protein